MFDVDSIEQIIIRILSAAKYTKFTKYLYIYNINTTQSLTQHDIYKPIEPMTMIFGS